MDQLRGEVARIFRYKKARVNGVSLNEIRTVVQERLGWKVRADYLLMAIAGKPGPYMLDVELRRVYMLGEGDQER